MTNRELIFKLRSLKMTYQEIGDSLGISKQRVHQVIKNIKFPYKRKTKGKWWKAPRLLCKVCGGKGTYFRYLQKHINKYHNNIKLDKDVLI